MKAIDINGSELRVFHTPNETIVTIAKTNAPVIMSLSFSPDQVNSFISELKRDKVEDVEPSEPPRIFSFGPLLLEMKSPPSLDGVRSKAMFQFLITCSCGNKSYNFPTNYAQQEFLCASCNYNTLVTYSCIPNCTCVELVAVYGQIS